MYGLHRWQQLLATLSDTRPVGCQPPLPAHFSPTQHRWESSPTQHRWESDFFLQERVLCVGRQYTVAGWAAKAELVEREAAAEAEAMVMAAVDTKAVLRGPPPLQVGPENIPPAR